VPKKPAKPKKAPVSDAELAALAKATAPENVLAPTALSTRKTPEGLSLPNVDVAAVEALLVSGDLSKLDAEQRVYYYGKTCQSLGLNPLTRPFDYINLNGKLVLYARKDATEQIRKIRGVSIEINETKAVEGVFVVVAKATDRDGRIDSATGAVNIQGLRGDALANAMMKAETKAKRRVTLSIAGLGLLDETELETIPGASPSPTPPPPASRPAPAPAKAPEPPKTKPNADWPDAAPKPETPQAAPQVVDEAPKEAEAPAPEGPKRDLLAEFQEACEGVSDDKGLKTAWDLFLRQKPSTAEAGKAWKIKSARASEILKGGR
jgi:hypothetical protein